MKIFLYTMLAIYLLIVSSCSNCHQNINDKNKDLMTERQKYFIENISSVKLIISMCGPTDYNLPPVLFHCSKDVNSSEKEFSAISQIKCDDFKKVLLAIYSKSNKNIYPDNAQLNSYAFSIYMNTEKDLYVYDYETSMKIFRDIKKIFRNDKNARKAMSLWGMSPIKF